MPTGLSGPVAAAQVNRSRAVLVQTDSAQENSTWHVCINVDCDVRFFGDLVRYSQTKRAAAGNADLLSDSEAAGDRSPQRLPDHGTAQPARQLRDHFKRAKADNGVAPECYVAALSLKNGDGDAAANIEQKQLQQQLRLSEVLLRRGKHDEALRLLETIIVSDPVNAEALHLRGQCFVAKNNSVGVRCSAWLHSKCLSCSLCEKCLQVYYINLALKVRFIAVGLLLTSACCLCCRHLQALLQQWLCSHPMHMLW